MKKIIIFNPFGIGDVIFSTPLVKILKQAYKDVEITYICNKRCIFLLKNNPNIKEVIVFEKDDFRKLFKVSKIGFLKQLIQYLGKINSIKADMMIDLSLSSQSPFFGILYGIKKRIGFNYKNRGKFLTDKIELKGFEEKHVVSYYKDLLKLIGTKHEQTVLTETFTDTECNSWADEILEKNKLKDKFLIGVIPGGGRSWGKDAHYRRWPVSHFAHIIDSMVEKLEVNVVLLGDFYEKELCNNLKSFAQHKLLSLAGETSVCQLMSLIKKCDMIFCNEGGPLHIAVALNVPTVSIFGPVDEKIYGPYTDDKLKHVIVSNREKCTPCYSRFRHKDCNTLICLNSISEKEVLKAVERVYRNITGQH